MLKETFTETINTERMILRKFESSDFVQKTVEKIQRFMEK